LNEIIKIMAERLGMDISPGGDPAADTRPVGEEA